MGYQTLSVRRLTGALGAVIEGVDLREPVADAQFEELHDALMAHHVLFLRDQDLSEAQHLAFAERFGTPSLYPVLQILEIEQRLEVIADNADSPPKADNWHTDVTWLPQPPKIAILNARVIPEYGGDTLWCDLFAAYESLSPTLQQMLDGLRVRHAPGDAFLAKLRAAVGDEVTDRFEREFGAGAEHPLVRLHPVTGRKALYVAGLFMDRVVGMDAGESEWLLAYLTERATQTSLQCRWAWRPFDVAIWDERCTMHRALADHYPQERAIRRCTIEGETPLSVGRST